jgi:hypothetical protein
MVRRVLRRQHFHQGQAELLVALGRVRLLLQFLRPFGRLLAHLGRCRAFPCQQSDVPRRCGRLAEQSHATEGVFPRLLGGQPCFLHAAQQRRVRRPPHRGVALLLLCLAPQRLQLLLLLLRFSLVPLLLEIPRPAAHQYQQQQASAGQRQRQPPRPPLRRRFLRRFLGSRLRRRTLDLGGAQALLNCGQVGGHPLGNHAGMARPAGHLGTQTLFRQIDQHRLCAATSEAHEGVGQVAALRLAQDLFPAAAAQGRLAREDGAQDATESKHVNALVGAIPLSVGLLRSHVRRRPQRSLRLQPSGWPRRRHLAVLPWRFLVRCIAAAEHLGESPVHDLDFAERTHHDVGRLQIPMDDALAVGVGQRLAHLLADSQKARQILSRR